MTITTKVSKDGKTRTSTWRGKNAEGKDVHNVGVRQKIELREACLSVCAPVNASALSDARSRGEVKAQHTVRLAHIRCATFRPLYAF
jgi:hypothetical protein